MLEQFIDSQKSSPVTKQLFQEDSLHALAPFSNKHSTSPITNTLVKEKLAKDFREAGKHD